MSNSLHALQRAIDAAGSVTRLAEMLGVHKSTVSDWKRTGVPAWRVVSIEQATGVPRAELCPELFAAAHAEHAAQHGRRKDVTSRTRGAR